MPATAGTVLSGHVAVSDVALRDIAMQVEYVSFQGREARSAYVAQRFKALFHGKVLDVGCDQAVL